MMKASRTRKTRFPIARIKKIMQANEDVGKLTITTPVVMSKAAELFIEEFVKNLGANAKKNRRNRVTLDDLREVIETVPKYDFLKIALDAFIGQ